MLTAVPRHHDGLVPQALRAEFPRTSAPKVMQGPLGGHENCTRSQCWSSPRSCSTKGGAFEDADGDVAVNSASTPSGL